MSCQHIAFHIRGKSNYGGDGDLKRCTFCQLLKPDSVGRSQSYILWNDVLQKTENILKNKL